MGYAEVADICISGYTDYDKSLIEKLIDRASWKIDGELLHSGVDPYEIEPALLCNCCCEMVEKVLDVQVGSDYGSTLDYTSANGRMQVPPEYKRMFGISAQRIAGLGI